MGIYSLCLANGHSIRHWFVWGMIIIGLVLMSVNGHAKTSKNESRNTFIGEGNTQVAAKAKTLSQCKSANGWCKPDTLVCD